MRILLLLLLICVIAVRVHSASHATARASAHLAIETAAQEHIKGSFQAAGALPRNRSQMKLICNFDLTEKIPEVTPVSAEAQYKALIQAGDPTIRNSASSLLGILYCQMQRPELAATLLEAAPLSDWVAHEYMG
jgi:hypothetical protein